MSKPPSDLQIQKLQGIFKDIAPGVSLADELILDRRQESLQDTEEWTGSIEDDCLHQAMTEAAATPLLDRQAALAYLETLPE
jgi:hypothetical protein